MAASLTGRISLKRPCAKEPPSAMFAATRFVGERDYSPAREFTVGLAFKNSEYALGLMQKTAIFAGDSGRTQDCLVAETAPPRHA